MTSLPDVLMPYQQRWIYDRAQVRVAEKSRRVGLSWATAAEAVITAGAQKSAGGMDVWYMGYTHDMAQQFLRDSAFFAKLVGLAASDVEEVVLQDEKHIAAFSIKFASGFRITGLSSASRNLRSKQGLVVIDEAAFHDDLDELLEAAMALTIWGGRIAVISTHNGVENAFNGLCNAIRAKEFDYTLHTITITDALEEGLFKRICLTTGEKWSPEAEEAFLESLHRKYKALGIQQELYCVPKSGGGAVVSRALIERQMFEAPVVRLHLPDDFAMRAAAAREAEIARWCKAELTPLLARLPKDLSHAFGEDFGRVSDLSVYAPVTVERNLHRRVPFIVELRNVPFDTQAQILFHLVDGLPRLIGGAMDATGSGAYLAEAASQRYPGHINQVHLSDAWYRAEMPRMQAALQDGTYWLPSDQDVLDDLRDLRSINGIIKLPKGKRQGTDGLPRHGDAAIALAMAYCASQMEVEEYGYDPVPLRPSGRRHDDWLTEHRVQATRGWRSRAGAL